MESRTIAALNSFTNPSRVEARHQRAEIITCIIENVARIFTGAHKFVTESHQLTIFLRLVLVLVALLGSTSVALSQSYCGRSSGYFSTEYGYKITTPLRALGERLSQNEDFVIVSKIDWPTADQDVASRVRRAAINRFRQAGGTEQPKIVRIIDSLMEDPRFSSLPRSTVETMVVEEILFNHTSYGGDIEYFYLYHSRPNLLHDMSGGIGYGKGVTIESAPENSRRLFIINGNRDHPFAEIMRRSKVRAVILDGINVRTDIQQYVRERTPVFHMSSTSAHSLRGVEAGYERIRSFLSSTRAPEDVVVLNLFPRQTDHALTWGFDELLSQQYADAGRLLIDRVERQGYTNSVTSLVSRAQFLASLRAAIAARKKVIVIAEADAEGRLRIPGSQETVSPGDIAQIGNLGDTYFLSCNSARIAIGDAALAFEGKIFTDDAALFIEFLLREDGAAETGGNVEARIVAPVHMEDVTGTVVRALNEAACVLADEGECTLQVTQIK